MTGRKNIYKKKLNVRTIYTDPICIHDLLINNVVLGTNIYIYIIFL